MHDAFISYATEDNDFAVDVALGLKTNGLSIWFAPLSLKVGNKLLDSIETGLQESRSGVLILSKDYLKKGWTQYEMDILVRQHIEKNKKILPVWLDVSKAEVEIRHSGLSGIVAITDIKPTYRVVSHIVEALSDGAPSRGVIPVYEDPAHRFLQGLGEVNLQTSQGPATTIFELLIHGKESDFPFWLAGRVYSRENLLFRVACLLPHVPDRARIVVGDHGYRKLGEMCVEHGFDPKKFE
jgi:TIR domain